MAVGKVSFEDCPMLTWSLGWMGDLLPNSPPTSWIARLLITSLVFMLDCVPDPVCHTYNGKWSSSLPAMTSSATRRIRSAFQAGSRPARPLTTAAAFLTWP
ncbi:hypothetical protein SVIO_009250 [Streptomyces violaceusniger]|uniref:Uncharacterized protein n=1 Tax=Streptomyces violaceusniger TaxID=68280 RepID=A0A4D4KNV3_STRVO|nr:hypothetical protein SVIO_009250 [Streptomyces violaceusniger]